MFSFLKAYRQNDPSLKSYLEVLLLLPGPKALFLYRFARLFYKVRLYFIARFISEVARFLTGIEIHPGAQIGKNLVIDHGMGLVIGETAVVGNNCLLYHGVTLGGVVRKGSEKRHPTLGDCVTVGAGAKVLGDIQVGDHSQIGAGAVVVKSCPEKSTMIGVPASQYPLG